MANINLSGSISSTGVSILGDASIIFASDANHTLSVGEYTNNFLNVTSSTSLTVTRNLIAPLVPGQSFIVQNNTTGGQSIQIIGSSGTGITISNGQTLAVVCDGDNYLSTSATGGAAGGDLSGTYPNPLVAALQGNPVAPQSLGFGQDGFALVWDGTDGYWKATNTGLDLLVGGDLGDFLPNPTVRALWTAAVPQVTPSNPSLTSGFILGNVLQVTNITANSQALGYGRLNLGTGSGATNVSGILPDGYQAPQHLTGDLSGFTNSSGSGFNSNSYGAIVTKLQTVPVQFASLGVAQDGYVLTYNNSNSQWQATANTSGASLSGDVTGSPGATFLSQIQNHPLSAASPGTGNVLSYNGSSWVPVDHTIAGDVTGTLSSATVAKLQGNAILPQSLSSTEDGYVLTWDNSTSKWKAEITAGGSLPGGGAGGDLSGFYPAPSVIAINGTSVPASPGTNQVLVASNSTTATWTKIGDNQITAGGINNVSISASAAIAGTKINPIFGSQAISGASVTATGAVRGTSFIVDNGSTLPTITSGTGVPATSPVNGSIFLRTDGASTGTESVYSRESGTWVPIGAAAAGTAGGDLSGNYPNPTVIALQNNPVSNLSLGATQDGYVLTWVNSGNNWLAKPSSSSGGSAGGDLSGTYPNPTVAKINGASVPSAGSLTTGNGLYVTGSSALTYSALNLAGGVNFVTGLLPTANQVAQSLTLTGDVISSGGTTTSASTNVVKLRGNPVQAGALGSTQDGYVLTWVNADGYYEAKPSNSFTAAGDLSGTSTFQTVTAIQGNHVSATTPAAGQFLIENSGATGSAWTSLSGDVSASPTTVGAITVTHLNSATVPAAGSLTTGNVLQVSGSSALTYAAVNLAGGSNFVTGVLPSGNQAAQTMGGDVSGTTASATVAKIQNNTVTSGALTKGQFFVASSTSNWAATTLSGDILESNATSGLLTVTAIQTNAIKPGSNGSTQDGYVLTWVNADGYWEAKPAATGSFAAGGDLTGTSSNQTVNSIQGVVISGSATNGDVLTASSPTAASWQPAASGSFSAGGDLSGTSSSQTVIALQGTPVKNTAPSDGYVLTYVTADGYWEPKPASSANNSNTFNHVTVTSSHTVDTGQADYYIFCNQSGAINITLPAPVAGRTLNIKDISGNAFTNNITIVRHASEKIDGVAASYVISENLGSVTLASDSTDWWIV